MKKTIFLLCLPLFLVYGQAQIATGQSQAPGRDKYTLLTMPYNMRPLTLYRGQLQLNGGYKFAIRSQSFNSEGDKIFLRKNGTGSVFHYYYVNAKFGLTNFLELGAETNFIRHGVRAESVVYTAASFTSSQRVTVNKINEIKGRSDLLLTASARLPLTYRWFDFGFTGGIYIPSAPYEQEKPAHTLSNITASDVYTVNYKYRFSNGYGVPVYLMSPQVKFTFRKISLQADLIYRTPAKEGTNVRWEENLVEKQFVYYDNKYKYLLSDSWTGAVALHYQATGWFDISLNTSWQKTSGGWTEYWGNKYKNKETRLLVIEPSFELQVSPALTVSQTAGFPVAGLNCDAPFYLFTTVKYSNFLFIR